VSVVVAELVRSEFVEGRHHGSVIALAADGSTAYAAGDVDAPVLPRSCNKPIQAVGMIRAGLDLSGHQLALAAASHSGEKIHVEGVREILAGAGLGEGDLQTPADYPLDDDERDELLRAGGARDRIHMNCSGKHAAMLATCVARGWDTASYLDPEHPLQRTIAETFIDVTGGPITKATTDGCGAPLLGTTLRRLAGGFARLATATEGPERRVADAIRAHPQYVSGTRRDEATLIRAIPGLIAKAGAEACYVAALADGRAIALKIEDGSLRARAVVMAGVLHRLGWDTGEGIDSEAVRRTGESPVLGGGHVIGELRASLG
jgi:L-asparaginase II